MFIILLKLYSYLRYSNKLFNVFCCNTMKASRETKKARLSYKKKYIDESE